MDNLYDLCFFFTLSRELSTAAFLFCLRNSLITNLGTRFYQIAKLVKVNIASLGEGCPTHLEHVILAVQPL